MKTFNFRANGALGVGSVSLILIFAVLCLSIFSLLAISSAKSESDLANKTAASVTAYFEADARAESILSQIRTSLANNQPIPDQFSETKIIHALSEDPKTINIKFSLPVDQANLLAVHLVYSTQEQCFEIKQWQLVPAEEWQPYEDFNVWDGEINTEN